MIRMACGSVVFRAVFGSAYTILSRPYCYNLCVMMVCYTVNSATATAYIHTTYSPAHVFVNTVHTSTDTSANTFVECLFVDEFRLRFYMH